MDQECRTTDITEILQPSEKNTAGGMISLTYGVPDDAAGTGQGQDRECQPVGSGIGAEFPDHT